MNTFNRYLLAEDKSEATIAIIERTIYSFCNWCDDEHIDAKQATYNEILAFIKSLQRRGWKQRTIQMSVMHLGHYFKWLIAIGVRVTHPCAGIKIKGVQRRFLYHIIPMPELEALYEKFTGNEQFLSGSTMIWDKQSHVNNRTQQIVFGLMIWQGIEVGELRRLTLTNLKLREGKIYIAGTRRTNERTLKLEAVQILDLMEYLQKIRPEYLRWNPKPTDHVFLSARGGLWGNNFMNNLIKYLHTFNPVITSSQQLRASVITYWTKKHNLRTAQYMAGHKYVSSTEKFLINDLDDLQEDIARFHPMA